MVEVESTVEDLKLNRTLWVCSLNLQLVRCMTLATLCASNRHSLSFYPTRKSPSLVIYTLCKSLMSKSNSITVILNPVINLTLHFHPFPPLHPYHQLQLHNRHFHPITQAVAEDALNGGHEIFSESIAEFGTRSRVFVVVQVSVASPPFHICGRNGLGLDWVDILVAWKVSYVDSHAMDVIVVGLSRRSRCDRGYCS
jgi:hypothetical protein